jgi:anthranilate/para-aminobenzoate synthase component I
MVMHGDTITIQAGAGIVADSDPTREHQECLNKAAPWQSPSSAPSAVSYKQEALSCKP